MTAATTDLIVTFQPMISTATGLPFAYRALAEGPGRRAFAAIAASLPPAQRSALEALRIERAVAAAVAAGLVESDALLTLPVSAATGDSAALLAHLFRVTLQHGFPTDRIVIEINADERGELSCATLLAEACAARGIAIALDNFAAGPLSLKLLSRFTPRFVKLDPALVHNVHASDARRRIAQGVMRLARSMGVTVLANDTDNHGERAALTALGICHFVEAATDPALSAYLARREPRSIVAQYRRLGHHQRAAATPAAYRPVQQLAAAL